MRVIGKGRKGGDSKTITLDLIDRYDPQTGFTSMERLTGWHASIMMIFQARGEVQPGANPVETAVPARDFIDELSRRGIFLS
jgi:lysine 6-dehydrogenase